MHPFIYLALYLSILFHSTEILSFGYLTTWTSEVESILFLPILLTCVSGLYYVIKVLLILISIASDVGRALDSVWCRISTW